MVLLSGGTYIDRANDDSPLLARPFRQSVCSSLLLPHNILRLRFLSMLLRFLFTSKLRMSSRFVAGIRNSLSRRLKHFLRSTTGHPAKFGIFTGEIEILRKLNDLSSGTISD